MTESNHLCDLWEHTIVKVFKHDPKSAQGLMLKVLKSKLSRTDRRTFRLRFRWEMLIHIWISPRHWKDASGEKRSLGSDTLYVFLCLETQVYKYIYVIMDHWFFWVTG